VSFGVAFVRPVGDDSPMSSSRFGIALVASLIAVAATSGIARADYGELDSESQGQYFQTTTISPGNYHRQPHRAAWFDFGLVRSQFAATTIGASGTSDTIVANTVRFGIGFMVSRHLYFGGDADFGTISDSLTDAGRVGARSANGQTTQMSGSQDALRGTTGGAHVLAGLTTGGTGLTASGELAAGVRLETTDGNSLAGEQAQSDRLLEARGRLQMFLSRGVTVGAVAGVDLLDHRDVSFGVTVGLHMYAWGTR
jgi:hypothetical protein